MDKFQTAEFLVAIFGVIALFAIVVYYYYEARKKPQADASSMLEAPVSAPLPVPLPLPPPVPSEQSPNLAIATPQTVYGAVVFDVHVTGIPDHGFFEFFVVNPAETTIQDDFYDTADLSSWDGSHTFSEVFNPPGSSAFPYGVYSFNAKWRASLSDQWTVRQAKTTFAPLSQSGEGQPQVISSSGCTHYLYTDPSGNVVGTGTFPTYKGPTIFDANGKPVNISARCWY